jgi:hypothetical protein
MSPTLQRAALDQHGRHGPRPLSSLASITRAFGGAIGIGLEFQQLGLEQDLLDQVSRPVFLSAETSTSCTSPPI